jgi:uncharacterized protein with PQ loop repeat
MRWFVLLQFCLLLLLQISTWCRNSHTVTNSYFIIFLIGNFFVLLFCLLALIIDTTPVTALNAPAPADTAEAAP